MIKTKDKENLIVIGIITLLSVILCFNFIKFHTVPDTYDVLALKQEQSLTFLQDGRIITGAYLYCLGGVLNISIPVLTVISSIIAILCQIISVYILYKALIKEESTIVQKSLILTGAFVTIFNPMSIEHLAYFESGIMCLGKLLCVISAKKLIIDNKKILPFALVILASMCYQGILNVFITISMLFILLQEDKNLKDKIKQMIWVGLISLTTFFLIIILIKGINFSLGKTEQRIGNIYIRKNYLSLLVSSIVFCLKESWNLFLKYFVFICLIFTIITLLMFRKTKECLNYVVLVIITLLVCIVPLLFLSYLSISARIISSVGSLVGISIIFLEKAIETDKRKSMQTLVIIFSVCVFAINAFGYIKNGVMINISNKLEREQVEQITDEIRRYEADTGKRINNIAIYYSSKPNLTFCNFPNNTFTIKSLYTKYARVQCIEYYLGHNLEEVDRKEEYIDYFKTKSYDNFQKEQLIFDENTLHLCVF